MSSAPVVRQISWLAVLPQLALLGVAMAIGAFATRTTDGLMLGAVAYIIYSFGSRLFIARDHRRGMRLFHRQQYAESIQAFEASYDFFTRHAWIDRWRAITIMSASAISYREMALCNIAFCYSQLGDGEQAVSGYRRTLEEFPNSGLASAALRMIEAIRQPPPQPTAEKAKTVAPE